MELRKEKSEGTEQDREEDSSQSKGAYEIGELFIEKTGSGEVVEEDGEELEAWGVYIQAEEKMILGLFWNEDLAELFMSSLNKSEFLEMIKGSV